MLNLYDNKDVFCLLCYNDKKLRHSRGRYEQITSNLKYIVFHSTACRP